MKYKKRFKPLTRAVIYRNISVHNTILVYTPYISYNIYGEEQNNDAHLYVCNI